MDILSSLWNLVSFIVNSIVSVIKFVSSLITRFFSIFDFLVEYLEDLYYIESYVPDDLQAYIYIICMLIVFGFVISVFSWVVHLIRG